MLKTHPCPDCGARMTSEAVTVVVSYKGHQRSRAITAAWCEKCGDMLADDNPDPDWAARVALQAEVDGVVGPQEVTAIRTLLGLSQRRAGEVLGGGPRAFQKYESGGQALSLPMRNLLLLLARDPARLREIDRDATDAPRAPNPTSAPA